MTDPIFRTARIKNEYNLSITRDEKGHIHVTIDQGSTGSTVVLSGFEVTGFIKEIAALQSPAENAPPADAAVPPHEPSTCGTGYLAAERALRVIENATKLGEAMSADAIEHIEMLAHEAGAACNRMALRRDAFADDPPF